MNVLLIILGIVLTALFFLNIKSAADILCRIIGGFALLLIYNHIAGIFSLEMAGINLFTSFVAGILGFPGAATIILMAVFL